MRCRSHPWSCTAKLFTSQHKTRLVWSLTEFTPKHRNQKKNQFVSKIPSRFHQTFFNGQPILLTRLTKTKINLPQ